MASLKLTAAELGRRADIPKATMSAIVNGKTHYYRELMNTIAAALNVRPYELLLHPDDAMAIRRLRDSAAQIAQVKLAADVTPHWNGPPLEFNVAR